ncbi:YbaB/EbfC family nucleoid-associated protein [Micromonospora sp. RHAY321]|uniref:YbaB/EbfC family nucleoid-associated protein n=1 Tax=Micromonospora sp. RHAY321 TaxID=2944807 RepID=UPI00207C910B|nr:YbaB/EbfC family nucleoid-associated protein [Micromonospora sp. RHAY321]MCO1595391.1 YbaB/EbfC family nucleoid-associated protein [Micromonospora sp. RHAY321]
MASGIDPSGLSRSLEEAMRLLSQATGSAVAQPGGADEQSEPAVPVAEQMVGRGTGGDGLVQAEVSAFGGLETLVIDASLSRAGTSAIAEYVLEAVRAAQANERARRAELTAAAGADSAALTRQLERVSADAFRGFEQMIGDLDAVTRRMDRR